MEEGREGNPFKGSFSCKSEREKNQGIRRRRRTETTSRRIQWKGRQDERKLSIRKKWQSEREKDDNEKHHREQGFLQEKDRERITAGNWHWNTQRHKMYVKRERERKIFEKKPEGHEETRLTQNSNQGENFHRDTKRTTHPVQTRDLLSVTMILTASGFDSVTEHLQSFYSLNIFTPFSFWHFSVSFFLLLFILPLVRLHSFDTRCCVFSSLPEVFVLLHPSLVPSNWKQEWGCYSNLSSSSNAFFVVHCFVYHYCSCPLTVMSQSSNTSSNRCVVIYNFEQEWTGDKTDI